MDEPTQPPEAIEVTKTTSVTSGPPGHGKIDNVLYLLFGGMVLFSVMLIIVERFFPMDGQIFQVVAGLLTGFSGAFFTRIKGAGGDQK